MRIALILAAGLALAGCEHIPAPSGVEAFCRIYEPVTDTDSPQTDRNNATWLCECRPEAAPDGLCDD